MVEFRRPGLLHLVKVIVTDLTADDNFLIIDFETVFYVEIMTRFGAEISEL